MIIAGLGNPGREYDRTRHNVGFWSMDALAKRFKTVFNQTKHQALVADFCFKGARHFLVKPQTFMNLSGESVSELLKSLQFLPQELLVIVDDVNLPVGRLRLRSAGSAGGHNGLKSIIGYIGEDFWRLRIGVGKPEGRGLVGYVLGEVTAEETGIFADLLEDVPEIVVMFLMESGLRAMSRFNGRNYRPLPEE